MAIAVKRALSLLDLFSEARPKIGLSDAARLSGQDKATVYRLMNTLKEADLIEQDATSKLYQLGPAVLRLARLREANVPMVSVAQSVLDALARQTGETAHCSLFAGGVLSVIAVCESNRPNHVKLRVAEVLPFNATGSGLVLLAYAAPELAARLRAQPLQRYTERTPTSLAALDALVQATRQQGFATIDQTYDVDVCGIAAPIFGPNRTAIGALAVASPQHRMTDAQRELIISAVKEAARSMTCALGHDLPSDYPL